MRKHADVRGAAGRTVTVAAVVAVAAVVVVSEEEAASPPLLVLLLLLLLVVLWHPPVPLWVDEIVDVWLEGLRRPSGPNAAAIIKAQPPPPLGS